MFWELHDAATSSSAAEKREITYPPPMKHCDLFYERTSHSPLYIAKIYIFNAYFSPKIIYISMQGTLSRVKLPCAG